MAASPRQSSRVRPQTLAHSVNLAFETGLSSRTEVLLFVRTHLYLASILVPVLMWGCNDAACYEGRWWIWRPVYGLPAHSDGVYVSVGSCQRRRMLSWPLQLIIEAWRPWSRIWDQISSILSLTPLTTLILDDKLVPVKVAEDYLITSKVILLVGDLYELARVLVWKIDSNSVPVSTACKQPSMDEHVSMKSISRMAKPKSW